MVKNLINSRKIKPIIIRKCNRYLSTVFDDRLLRLKGG